MERRQFLIAAGAAAPAVALAPTAVVADEPTKIVGEKLNPDAELFLSKITPDFTKRLRKAIAQLNQLLKDMNSKAAAAVFTAWPPKEGDESAELLVECIDCEEARVAAWWLPDRIGGFTVVYDYPRPLTKLEVMKISCDHAGHA